MIRELTRDDKTIIQDFFDRMGGESRSFFNRGDGNYRWIMEFWDDNKAAKNNTMKRWIGYEDDPARVTGYVFLWDINKGIPWLGIAVAEEEKGKHFGRELIAHAEKWARENNKGGILLTTHTSNMRGQGLYEHCGFERQGIHTTGEILYLKTF